MARQVHLLVLAFMIGSLVSFAVSRAQDASPTLRPQTQTLPGSAFRSVKPDEGMQGAGIEPGILDGVIETEAMAAPAPFTYVMLRWRASAAAGAVSLAVRASEDGERWSVWGVVSENDDLHDAADPPDLHWSET